MFKLILEHEYHKARPAVDTSRFMQHGRVIDAAHHPDGRDVGSGSLIFSAPSSAVRVPSGPSWQNMGALAVQIWVKLNSLPGQRQNLIEGDNCFALFVDPHGAVIASFLGMVEGQAALHWNVVSTDMHSPTGQIVSLQPGVWTFLSFVFDGLGRARIWVDDQLAAVRTDFASGVGSVGSAGVVIGNWTLSNQYWLDGEIDSVRVWKEDPVAPLVQFYSRITPDQRQAWDRFFECLARMNPDRMQQIKSVVADLNGLFIMVVRGLYNAPDYEREHFFMLLQDYQEAWKNNNIATPEHAHTVFELSGFLESFSGSTFVPQFQQLTAALNDLMQSEIGECLWSSGVDGLDDEFVRFIEQATWQFGGTS